MSAMYSLAWHLMNRLLMLQCLSGIAVFYLLKNSDELIRDQKKESLQKKSKSQ